MENDKLISVFSFDPIIYVCPNKQGHINVMWKLRSRVSPFAMSNLLHRAYIALFAHQTQPNDKKKN